MSKDLVHESKIYVLVKWFAILGAVLWLSWEIWGYFGSFAPGDGDYFAGNRYFKDGRYIRAEESYKQALEQDTNHFPALRGLANSYILQERYDLALVTINRVISRESDLGANYAIRGIVYDWLGDYDRAMLDYEHALSLDADLFDGMHWLDRFLYNLETSPPTIADRLLYLRTQMALPARDRVLRRPLEDKSQRPYER